MYKRQVCGASCAGCVEVCALNYWAGLSVDGKEGATPSGAARIGGTVSQTAIAQVNHRRMKGCKRRPYKAVDSVRREPTSTGQRVETAQLKSSIFREATQRFDTSENVTDCEKSWPGTLRQSFSTTAVSYTHLDVYKRQVLFMLCMCLCV